MKPMRRTNKVVNTCLRKAGRVSVYSLFSVNGVKKVLAGPQHKDLERAFVLLFEEHRFGTKKKGRTRAGAKETRVTNKGTVLTDL